MLGVNIYKLANWRVNAQIPETVANADFSLSLHFSKVCS